MAEYLEDSLARSLRGIGSSQQPGITAAAPPPTRSNAVSAPVQGVADAIANLPSLSGPRTASIAGTPTANTALRDVPPINTEPEPQRGLFGKIGHALSSAATDLGRYITTPGVRQGIAQLAEQIGTGNPLAEGLAKFAQQTAKQDQYERIKQYTLKGLELGPEETAGLDPNEVEMVRQRAIAEQEAKLEKQRMRVKEQDALLTSAQQRLQSEAQTKLAAAQADKLQQEPSFAEKAAEERRQAAIRTGVQSFQSGTDQTTSFIFDAEGKPVIVGKGSKSRDAGGSAADNAEAIRLDLSHYKAAIDRANEQAEASGKFLRDPTTGKLKPVGLSPEQAAYEYNKLVKDEVGRFTQQGLIKNPAYLQATEIGIPLEYEGATFAGKFSKNGKPIYTKDGKEYTLGQ